MLETYGIQKNNLLHAKHNESPIGGIKMDN